MKINIDTNDQAIVRTIGGEELEVVKINFEDKTMIVKIDISDDGEEEFGNRLFTFDELESIEFI